MTTVAYLGFIAGSAYVGAWADAVGLPGAMLAVAAPALALATLAGATVRSRLPLPRWSPLRGAAGRWAMLKVLAMNDQRLESGRGTSRAAPRPPSSPRRPGAC